MLRTVPVRGPLFLRTHALQVLQNFGHGGVQAARNDLKRNQACFPFSRFNVRDVTAIQVKADRHVHLGPSLGCSQSANPLPDGHQ